MKLKTTLIALTFGLLPIQSFAETLELSQAQLRQLVVESQILDAETVVTDVAQNFGGVVLDIRGFLAEGQMTYRLLMQRDDGSVIEVLVNGVSGQRVSHRTPMGQIVSAAAREMNGNSNSNRGNRGNNGVRGNNRGNDNGNGRGNSGRGNRGNNGGGNGNGNGNGRK